MSDLRQQLEQMKATYPAAKYAADLAADVLRIQHRGRRDVIVRIGIGALAGVAAAIAVYVSSTRVAPPTSGPQNVVAVAPTPTTVPAEQRYAALNELPAVPSVPSDVPLSPS